MFKNNWKVKNVNTHPDEIYTTLYILLVFKAKETRPSLGLGSSDN